MAGDTWLSTNICSSLSQSESVTENGCPSRDKSSVSPLYLTVALWQIPIKVYTSKSDIISRSGLWEISESSLLSLLLVGCGGSETICEGEKAIHWLQKYLPWTVIWLRNNFYYIIPPKFGELVNCTMNLKLQRIKCQMLLE